MNILITNDDGIEAEGIKSLLKILSQDHEVYMIAPNQERSACSNIFTMREAVTLEEVEPGVFSLSGYPADCVSVGIHSDLFPKIDLVVSGINHGPNLGDDIHFSGTVAAARTAHIFQTNSLAISMNSYHKPSKYFDEASLFIKQFISQNPDYTSGTGLNYFLNINYPDLPKKEILGVKYTFLSKRYYIDRYDKEKQKDKVSLKIKGHIESEEEVGNDASALEKGYISITPLTIDSTDYGVLKTMKGD